MEVFIAEAVGGLSDCMSTLTALQSRLMTFDSTSSHSSSLESTDTTSDLRWTKLSLKPPK